MATAHIVYDNRSGRILGVHHGETDHARARDRAQKHAKVDAEHIAVIQVDSATVARGKTYQVDMSRKTLVEVADAGTGFAVGKISRSS